ncbi:hypothetical protein [Fluviicola sp.]
MKSLKKTGSWQVSEVELVYKYKVSLALLPRVTEPSDTYKDFSQHWDMD